MKVLFFWTLILLSQASLAGFAGDWSGWGSWKFKGEGDGASCTSMKMKWSESVNHIAIESGFFDCEVVIMELSKTEWKLESGQLYDEQNKKVGSYDGTHFEVDMPSPNEKTTIHISATRNANHFDYQEIWFNQFEKVYVIQGRLFTGGK